MTGVQTCALPIYYEWIKKTWRHLLLLIDHEKIYVTTYLASSRLTTPLTKGSKTPRKNACDCEFEISPKAEKSKKKQGRERGTSMRDPVAVGLGNAIVLEVNYGDLFSRHIHQLLSSCSLSLSVILVLTACDSSPSFLTASWSDRG